MLESFASTRVSTTSLDSSSDGALGLWSFRLTSRSEVYAEMQEERGYPLDGYDDELSEIISTMAGSL